MWEGKVRKTQTAVLGGRGSPGLDASATSQAIPGFTTAWRQTGQAQTCSCRGGLEQLYYFGENFTKSCLIPCRLCKPGTVICVLLEQIFLKYHSVCVSLLPSLNFGPECIPINIALKALETVRSAPLWSPLWFLLCLIWTSSKSLFFWGCGSGARERALNLAGAGGNIQKSILDWILKILKQSLPNLAAP